MRKRIKRLEIVVIIYNFYIFLVRWDLGNETWWLEQFLSRDKYPLGFQLVFCKSVVRIVLTCVRHAGTLNSLEENTT